MRARTIDRFRCHAIFYLFNAIASDIFYLQIVWMDNWAWTCVCVCVSAFHYKNDLNVAMRLVLATIKPFESRRKRVNQRLYRCEYENQVIFLIAWKCALNKCGCGRFRTLNSKYAIRTWTIFAALSSTSSSLSFYLLYPCVFFFRCTRTMQFVLSTRCIKYEINWDKHKQMGKLVWSE